MALDEACFHFQTEFEAIWLLSGATARSSELHKIQSNQKTITLFGNPRGLSRVCALENGGKFNVDSYISEIIPPVPHWPSAQTAATD
jgi:hypothetical protein